MIKQKITLTLSGDGDNNELSIEYDKLPSEIDILQITTFLARDFYKQVGVPIDLLIGAVRLAGNEEAMVSMLNES